MGGKNPPKKERKDGKLSQKYLLVSHTAFQLSVIQNNGYSLEGRWG